MVRKRKSNVAEGAERPLTESSFISTIRGGNELKYFFKYPNVVGSGTFAIKDE